MLPVWFLCSCFMGDALLPFAYLNCSLGMLLYSFIDGCHYHCYKFALFILHIASSEILWRRMMHFVNFPPFLKRDTSFVTFWLFCYTFITWKKGVYSRSKLFPFRVDNVPEREKQQQQKKNKKKKNDLTEQSPMKVYYFPWRETDTLSRVGESVETWCVAKQSRTIWTELSP